MAYHSNSQRKNLSVKAATQKYKELKTNKKTTKKGNTPSPVVINHFLTTEPKHAKYCDQA